MNNLSPLPPESPAASASERNGDLVASQRRALQADADKPFDSHLKAEAEPSKPTASSPEEVVAEKNRKKAGAKGDETAAAERSATMMGLRVPPLLTASPADEATSGFPLGERNDAAPDPLAIEIGAAGSSAEKGNTALAPKAAPGPDSQPASATSSAVTTSVAEADAMEKETVGPAKNSEGRERGATEDLVAVSKKGTVARGKATPGHPLRIDGTDAARQQVEMSTAEPAKKPASNLLDLSTTPIRPETSVLPANAAAAARDFSPGDRENNRETSPQPRATDSIPQLKTESSISSSAGAESAPKSLHAEQANRVFNQVSDVLQNLRSDGRTNVEMQIKLQDGEQLTVRLQIHGGEVRAIFKTDSSEWREAIARGWSNFSSNSAERGLRVTTPVFESPSAQAGLNDFSNQRQPSREQAEAAAQHNPFSELDSNKNKKPALRAVAPAPSVAASSPGAGWAAWA